jgi:putative tricarboxylic transport membrane protein
MTEVSAPPAEPTPPWLRQDTAAGLVVIAVAAFALWQGASLTAGSLGAIGAGMLPRALAVLFGGLGLVLLVTAMTTDGERLQRWSLRGPVMILAAVITFGLSVRPVGLAVAGPLTVIVGAAASPETRWSETLISSVVMTTFCVLLFKFALGLAIPLAPWLVGY